MNKDILKNMVKLQNVNQISEGDRLFYELGYKINSKVDSYENNWIKSGQFKEIDNVQEYILKDKMLLNKEYIEHHNFMIIKK